MNKIVLSTLKEQFSEAVKTLLTCLIRDAAMAVPLQPIVNDCAEVFMMVNYLYLVIVEDSISMWCIS